MAYSAEVVRRARAHLAQAKEDRESENRQHLAEAYRRVPRIKEIDMQLRITMAKAAQAAFLQGGDGQELLILITELTAHYHAARFIARYGCEAYYRHNQELMFYQRKTAIIRELEQLSSEL